MTNKNDQWSHWLTSQTDSIRAAGQWRQPVAFDAVGPTGTFNGKLVTSFASNDYLGLTHHPVVSAAAQAAIGRWGTGSGASRLIVGSRPLHHDLEDAIATWRHTESAMLFPTGFAANLGLLSCLGSPGVRIHSDELNHASIIDGCRMARMNGAMLSIYRHRDLQQLEVHLAEPGADRQIVVTDSVFSMDGDVIDFAALVALCERYDALLILDEAHGVLQSVPVAGSSDVTIVQVGTLSKSVGSLGGFVAAPTSIIELLVNRARSYIFTTAPSPADTAAALAAIEIITSDEGAALISRLRQLVERVKPGHHSPIIPIVLGDEQSALNAARSLLEKGILVPAIRPPTVPVGSSRLRVALSAAHTDEQIEALLKALHEL